ncbi:MAG: hypothetical protein KIC94_12735 [Clostridiales bacterium]|nr:hypothetical protein [Clostridiales bacterium]
MYSLINKELRIATCKMSELPKDMADMVQPVETITVMYDSKEDIIVLNTEYELFDICMELSSRYLQLEKSDRDELAMQLKDGLKSDDIEEIIDMLEQLVVIREAKQYDKILKKIDSTQFFNVYELLSQINNNSKNGFEKEFKLFQMGYILGKREERARRKKVNVVTAR